MSLLPEFNYDFFVEICNSLDLTNMEDHKEIAQRNAIFSALSIQSGLLNPDRNPLTFEEVKAWFDLKVVQKHSPKFTFIGECAHPNKGIFYYHYNIHSDKHSESCGNFFLSETGYLRSLNRRDGFAYSDILKEHDFFYNISELIDIKPLELFCQMKGYVDGL